MAKSTKNTKKDKSAISKLRISIINDESHKELRSFKTTKGNLITIISLVVFLIIVITYCLTAFTGIRHTIPGYPSTLTRNTAIDNALKIDSLEKVIDGWAFQLANIQRVATGRNPLPTDSLISKKDSIAIDAEAMAIYAKSDSLLREQVKNEEKYSAATVRSGITQIEGLHFFTPVKGMVTQEFNPAIGHPFVDIAAPANTQVCAILDGTVISADWNDQTGYTLTIQHDNNIISVYKHNEKLLKKAGDKVLAGMPVAIIGNTGNLSTGIHLHFELWYKGEAINPSHYISF